MASKRVLVTGASGLLGRALIAELKSSGFEVLGLAYSRATGDLIKCDLNDEAQVSKVIDEFKPLIVIHAAAQRAPDEFDKNFEQSYKLNVTVSKWLAELCSTRAIAFIQISTDYVFDGSSAPYSELDKVCPINEYGRSKADAEEAVTKATGGRAVILRVPVLYGDEEHMGESAISGLLSNLMDRSKTRKVSSYEVRRPACTEDIAFICVRLAEKKLEDPDNVSGVYQWSGLESMSKCEMVKLMGKVLKLNTDHIEADPSPGTGAPRPRDVTMSRARLEALGISRHTPFQEAVKKHFAKFAWWKDDC